MNKAEIIAFYQDNTNQSLEENFDLLPEEDLRNTLFTQPRISTKIQQKRNLNTKPVSYCLLAIIALFIDLLILPNQDIIYFVVDNKIAYNICLTACFSGLTIIGIMMENIIMKSFTTKELQQVPFLTKKSQKLNFNPTICILGQIAHIIMLCEIIIQSVGIFTNGTLIDISFLLNIVYFTYANTFLERINSKSKYYTPYIIYMIVTLTCIITQYIRVLCQNFMPALHFYIWRVQAERTIMIHLAILLQGIQFQLFSPVINKEQTTIPINEGL